MSSLQGWVTRVRSLGISFRMGQWAGWEVGTRMDLGMTCNGIGIYMFATLK
jgi:hypothetical protein